MSVKASPKKWIVASDGPADFRTIQEALINKSVVAGDTIFVRKGTYYGNILVDKSVSLVGEDRDLTLIEGDGTSNVISIIVDNVNIINFTIKKSGITPYNSAIRIESSSGNVIRYNSIRESTNGISIYFSSSNTISGNNVSSNNFYGVYLYSSSGNVIFTNDVSNNLQGISLYSSDGNTISGNDVFFNSNSGIYLTFSGNNIIYHNNFNNTNQALSDLANFWSYGGEGNYWSDYNGRDINGNGIGDSPYFISIGNKDDSPLMGMFSDFTVVFERETYHIVTISNSTISELVFEIGAETGGRIIQFNVIGESGTAGFCRIMVPTKLMSYPLAVLVDNEEVAPTLLNVSDETYDYLYFTYIPGNHTIKVVSSKMLHFYNELSNKYAELQEKFYDLNETYYELLNNYSILLDNYSELNMSYQEHLVRYSEQIQNVKNLAYIFAATTGVIIIVTIYLSKRAHTGMASKAKTTEDEK